MPEVPKGRPAPQMMALWCVLFARSAFVRHLRLFVEDMVSKNQGPAIARLYEEWPATEADWRARGNAVCDGMRRRLASSVVILLAIAAAALLFSFAAGILAASLPVSASNVLGFVGVSLIAWATIFGLGTAPATWGGVSLPELLVPKIFVLLFSPGTVFALVGGLM